MDLLLSLWLAPLIVGVAVALIGYTMYRSGMNRLRKDDMVPHRTAQTMREKRIMDARTRDEIRPGRGYSLNEDNPNQIKRNIDRTRAHLDATVDEISNRLSPHRMVDEFVDMFAGRRDGGATGRAGTTDLLRSIRDNPIPAALIGAGVAWFLFDRTRGSGSQSFEGGSILERQVGRHGDRDWLAPGAEYVPQRTGHSADSGKIREKIGDLREKSSGAIDSGRERLGQAGRGLRDWAHDAGESISNKAHQARERLSHTAGSARERMSRHGDGMHLRERAGHTAHNIRNVVEEHPLVIGAAALAVGLIAGLAAPPTRIEREVMGQMRDDQLDDAKRAAKEDVIPKARETAKHVAREAGAAASGKPSDEADTRESLAESTPKVASTGIHRAGDSLRERMHQEDRPQRQQQGRSHDTEPRGF